MVFRLLKKKKEAEQLATVSTRSAPTASSQATIDNLRQSIKNQEKREAHLTRKVNEVLLEAKQKLANGNKKEAVFCMKRKKMYEEEIKKIENVKITLEMQCMNLESAASNANMIKAMQQGTSQMQKIRKEAGCVDKVDDIMDEMREEFELASELNNALGQTDPLLGGLDDEELMAELDIMMEQPTPSQKTERLRLPDVPNTKLSAQAKKEADDLKQLEAELAIAC